ncbi:MAG TPA: alpha-ketoglutarate-dependent dioxygenase AlkB [Polyangiaceae bacterium]
MARNERRFELEDGAELVVVTGFLSAPERAALLDESQSYPWEQKPVMGVPTLRKNAWFADDPSAIYEYSGQRWLPVPLTPRQTELRDRLERFLDERLDAVLAGYYPHGGAGVGYHADDEPILGPNPTIASLSIGARRVFQVARTSRARLIVAELELPLDDGDLLVMRKSFQRCYRHALKKESKSIGPRLNLSYRKLVASGGAVQQNPASRA